MALLWDFKELEFVLLDYMAVAKEYRNNNFGTLLFKFLTNNVNKCKKYMIIEVENYLFGKNKESFGHNGWGGSLGFADPMLGIGVSYTTNKINPTTSSDQRIINLLRKFYEII